MRHVLVEHQSTINSLIQTTFTERTKFTSFDVSPKYIIFGVKSGGIYIFSRDPCQFLKLIPSTHGPATLISISDNEENLGIAVASGLVLVLESAFGSNFRQKIITEHERQSVSAMKWNHNDLYCGDSTGKVSVFTVNNFLLANSLLFHNQAVCLLHLDSQIVQIDTHSNFMLISTSTRTLLCNTESERYRQIGKKLRDGPFGACFLRGSNVTVENITAPQSRGLFQDLGDEERMSHNFDDSTKIYCARPGARIWQANFQGDVILTHQFRQSFINLGQSDVIAFDYGNESYKVVAKSDRGLPENYNFDRIFPLLNKFIISFRSDGFYVFKPCSSSLLYWNASCGDIKDIKVVDSHLYIWHSSINVRVISLLSLEELIVGCLYKKHFTLCAKLIAEHIGDVDALVRSSNSRKIHLVSVLESKITDPDLLTGIAPILDRLREQYDKFCSNDLEVTRKGIVVVNDLCNIKTTPEPIVDVIIDPTMAQKSILLEQHKISKIDSKIETNDFASLLKTISCSLLYQILNDLMAQDAQLTTWCKQTFLKYLSVQNSPCSSPEMSNFARDAFFELNDSHSSMACAKCHFPLPKAHLHVPKYYEVGCKLCEDSRDYSNLLTRVPYLYNSFLGRTISSRLELASNLSLLIQFSDLEVIGNISGDKFTYDIWDEAFRMLIKLKRGACLNCGSSVDVTGVLDFQNLAMLIVQSIRAPNALKLIKRYSSFLPRGTLNDFFYQFCIFSTLSPVDNNNFKLLIGNEPDGEVVTTYKEKFAHSVGSYLHSRHFHGDQHLDRSKTCDYCHLLLGDPGPDDQVVKKLNCGHKYHQMCFLYIKGRCRVCYSVDNTIPSNDKCVE